MKEISRRAVLVGAAAATFAVGLPASAACAEPAKEPEPLAPAKEERVATSECGELGSTRTCVTAREFQDVSALQYVITNGGNESATYTVWYVDVTGGPESGRVTETVEAGETAIGYFYGALQHCFTLHVCHEAECMTLGPVCAEYPSDW